MIGMIQDTLSNAYEAFLLGIMFMALIVAIYKTPEDW